MSEALLVLQEWQPSFLDVLFLLVIVSAVVFLVFEHRKRRKVLNSRHDKIMKFIDRKGRTTTPDAARLLKVSEDTALRELAKLVDMKILKRKGAGSNVSYVKR